MQKLSGGSFTAGMLIGAVCVGVGVGMVAGVRPRACAPAACLLLQLPLPGAQRPPTCPPPRDPLTARIQQATQSARCQAPSTSNQSLLRRP